MTPDFLITALIVCLAPGIGVIYTLSMALGGGLSRGLWAALGCTIVTAIHLIAALAGLAAVLHASAVLFQAVKLAGVAYLMWMAWTTLSGRGALDVNPSAIATQTPPIRVVWRGVVLNLLNPKLPIFFMAFLPQFIPAGAPDAATLMIQLGFAFVAITGFVMVGYACVAGGVRIYVVENARAMAWLRRIFAASFAALAARLAAERA